MCEVIVRCSGCEKADRIIALLENVMATQAELLAQVNAVKDQLTKIATETKTLLTRIEELQAVVANGPPVSAELQAAVTALVEQAKAVDDLVPDSVPAAPQ